jgi:hypothetical protein
MQKVLAHSYVDMENKHSVRCGCSLPSSTSPERNRENFQDIRNLLLEWDEDINDCERIWIRASGSNRKIFMDYEGAVIPKGDERLRTFPFPTRRPVCLPFAYPVPS